MRKAKRLSILTAAFAALAILSGCVVMGPQTTIPQGAYEPSVGGWEMTPEGRTMRASSADANWEDGNGDARAIAPGETLTIAELEGPGRINHIWFTMMSASIVHPRTTTWAVRF